MILLVGETVLLRGNGEFDEIEGTEDGGALLCVSRTLECEKHDEVELNGSSDAVPWLGEATALLFEDDGFDGFVSVGLLKGSEVAGRSCGCEISRLREEVLDGGWLGVMFGFADDGRAKMGM